MRICGIIAEYDPLHCGHAWHLSEARRRTGADYVVCVMSGSFTQRGMPALLSPHTRAEMALRAGADLVLQLPVSFSLCDAERFALGGVEILRQLGAEALCFGAEAVTWGCYTAGWWHNQVLDDKGEKTEQYDKLKTVNAELRAVGDAYMKYRNVSTHFIGFTGKYAPESVKVETKAALNTGVFSGVRMEDGAPLLAGQMVARDGGGKQALYLCNASDPWGDHPTEGTVIFATDGSPVRILTAEGAITPETVDGQFRFRLPSCGGALVTAE